jgi:hypothetical protein
MTWSWAALIAALLAGGTALYIRLRWRRSPQAFTAMVAVAVCFFVSGAVLGAWVLPLLGPGPPSPTPLPSEQPSGAALASPQPSPVASPIAGFLPGESCGAERWLVKTLSDPDAGNVNLNPVPETVADLIKLTPPAIPPANGRVAPVELTTYKVRAVVLERRHEQDHDTHLVIAEPGGPADMTEGIIGATNKTMIAEVVDPACHGALTSREVADFKRVRDSMEDIRPGATVEITGVGFFDEEHGASGAAPNDIELHPVLAVRRVN